MWLFFSSYIVGRVCFVARRSIDRVCHVSLYVASGKSMCACAAWKILNSRAAFVQDVASQERQRRQREMKTIQEVSPDRATTDDSVVSVDGDHERIGFLELVWRLDFFLPWLCGRNFDKEKQEHDGRARVEIHSGVWLLLLFVLALLASAVVRMR